MARLTDAQKHFIDKALERLDFTFSELCDCIHELEGCGCKKQIKKLDTITGNVENLIHELHDKIR